MRISLSQNIINFLKRKNLISKVKIIKIFSDSTIIIINGKKLKIPFKLKEKIEYIAIFKEKNLYIKEKDKNNTTIYNNKKVQKNKINKILNLIYNLKEDFEKIESNEKGFLFFNFFIKKNDDNQKNKRKEKNYILQDGKNESYYFFFNLPFYFNDAKIFIVYALKKNIHLNIFIDNDINEQKQNEFKEKLIKKFETKKYNFTISIYNTKDDFYKKIYMIINKTNIDIKI